MKARDYQRWLRPGYLWLIPLAALGAGLVASLIAVTIMGILRIWAGIPTPVELFGEFYIKQIDIGTFLRLLREFAPNPKTGPLGMALLGMIGIGTVLGLLYAAIVRLPARTRLPGKREWLTAITFMLAMWLTGTLLFWNELRANFLGQPLTIAILLTSLAMLLVFACYSISLLIAYRVFAPMPRSNDQQQEPPRINNTRRTLLTRLGVILVGLGTFPSMYGLIQRYLSNQTLYDGTGPMDRDITPLITPTSQHYVVTKNTVDPAPIADLWQLEITGLIQQSGTYTYQQIQELPTDERAITMECIANGVGRVRLMSTAIWRGIPLKDMLDRHGGALPTARYIVFYSIDGYNITQPLDAVLEADALLAWQMNSEPLPNRHGFPLRLILPGYYGEQSPKWLTRIDFTDQFIQGLYSSQGWSYGPLHMTSRFDRPRQDNRITAGQTINVGGIAFAGYRGISKVEFSENDGQTWREAILQSPLSKDSWVAWSLDWTAPTPGTYTLVVRATNKAGELQTSHEQGTVPNGATGYHKVTVEVLGA